MFTGLIQCIGEIADVQPVAAAGQDPSRGGVRLRVQAPSLGWKDVAIGDSIAIQGACMTAVVLHADGFEVDVSRESLDRTVGLDRIGPVNLEAAMRLGDRLGGHLVSGHVDGVGRIATLESVGESRLFEVRVPADLAGFIAHKGSIAIDGVSLTVNTIRDEAGGHCTAAINLIPHTVLATTLRHRQVGDLVNIEVDLIARHVARLMQIRPVH